jgi:hypothetical protein
METVFAGLFKLLGGSPTDDPPFSNGIQGKDWNGNPLPLVYASRNWRSFDEAVQGQMPSLYQLDPFKPELLTRTGRGRRRRKPCALISVFFTMNIGTSDAQPWNTLFNNWTTALHDAMSPLDDPGLTLGVPNQITDFGPRLFTYDYGLKTGAVGLVQCIVDIETGG